MTMVRVLTRNGDNGPEPIGLGFYYAGWRDSPAACLSQEFTGGMVRRVFVDKHGRALMTGWFRPEAYEI